MCFVFKDAPIRRTKHIVSPSQYWSGVCDRNDFSEQPCKRLAPVSNTRLSDLKVTPQPQDRRVVRQDLRLYTRLLTENSSCPDSIKIESPIELTFSPPILIPHGGQKVILLGERTMSYFFLIQELNSVIFHFKGVTGKITVSTPGFKEKEYIYALSLFPFKKVSKTHES